jgi:hypothetical protein
MAGAIAREAPNRGARHEMAAGRPLAESGTDVEQMLPRRRWRPDVLLPVHLHTRTRNHGRALA